ncbi:MAG: DUF2179 domain-containing protein [Gemmataceae bacterium]
MSILFGLPSLPFLVFFAELSVVTLGTIRIIFVSRGMKRLAPLLGTFEVSIWLFAIGQIMKNLNDLSCYVAFTAGFGVGTYLGIFIERKLALGNLMVLITSHRNTEYLIDRLKCANFGVTRLDAQGAKGPVQVVSTVIKRKELESVVAIIKEFDSKAFYSVNELQSAEQGVSPSQEKSPWGALANLLKTPGISPGSQSIMDTVLTSARPITGGTGLSVQTASRSEI